MLYNLIEKKNVLSNGPKKVYSSINQMETIYIFDITLSNLQKNKNKKIRKIKNLKCDHILDASDKINFYKYQNILIKIININSLDMNEVNLNLEYDKNNIYQDDYIYLEFTNDNKFLKCYYNIL